MWQNRIYALIIRRILGPYLTPSSRRELQNKLNISLRQGRVTLNSLELDGKVLTAKLLSKNPSEDSGSGSGSGTTSGSGSGSGGNLGNICIENVKVNELNISLFLVYNDYNSDYNDNGDANTNANSNVNSNSNSNDENDFMKNITGNGNNSSNNNNNISGARLVAKVVLNGVHVNVRIDPSSKQSNVNANRSGSTSTAPSIGVGVDVDNSNSNSNSSKTNEAIAITTSTTSTSTSTSTARGFIQSYVQAALDSLKLSLDIQNLSIQLSSTSSLSSSLSSSSSLSLPTPATNTSTCKTTMSWMRLNLNALSYKDSSLPPPPSTTVSRDQDDDDDDDDENHGNLTVPLHYQQKQQQRQQQKQMQQNPPIMTTKSKIVLGKEICFDQLWIELGTGTDTCTDTCTGADLSSSSSSSSSSSQSVTKNEIVRFNGVATVIATIMSNTKTTFTSKSMPKKSSTSKSTSTSTTQDYIERHLEIALDDTLDINIHPVQLQIINDLLIHNKDMNSINSIPETTTSSTSTSTLQTSNNDANIYKTPTTSTIRRGQNIITEEDDNEDDDDEDEDEQDLGLLSNILKQQQQQIESSSYMSSPPSTFSDYYKKRNDDHYDDNIIIPTSSKNYVPIARPIVTRKQQQQQQPLSTSSSSLDGFFHTNEEGYSHYCNILASSAHEEKNVDNIHKINQNPFKNDADDTDDRGSAGGSAGGSSSNLITSTVCFYLKEVMVNIHLYSFHDHDNDKSGEFLQMRNTNQHYGNEFICLTIVDFNAVLNQLSQSTETELSLDVKDFAIEHVVQDKRNMDEGETASDFDDSSQDSLFHSQRNGILVFLKDSTVLDNSSSNIDRVATMNYCSKQHEGSQEDTKIEVMLMPFLLHAEKDLLFKICDTYSDSIQKASSAPTSDACLSTNEGLNVSKRARFKLECKYIALEIPLFKTVDGNIDADLAKSVDLLFNRCGYVVEETNQLSGPTLSLAATNLDLNIFNFVIGHEQRDMEVTASLQNSVVSLIAPMSTNNSKYNRFDFISIDSETQIDPDSVIKIEYSKMALDDKSDAFKKKRAKKYFPFVVPLASVKASQQFDHDEDNNVANFTLNSKTIHDTFVNGAKSMKRNVRGADPQVKMLKESGLCENNMLVSIPSIAMDLTMIEKDLLLHVISQFKLRDDENNVESEKEANGDGASIGLGLSFHCNQFTLSLHHNFGEQQTNPIYTQLLIWDGLHSHCLLGKEGLKHIRLISEDVTLYESNHNQAQKMPPAQRNVQLQNFSVKDMSNAIRKRRFLHSEKLQSRAIFFRSKLSHPLSPKTPALILDMIIRKQEDDFDDIERAIYFSVYDLTYRHDLESTWVDRLKDVFQRSNDSAEANKDKEGIEKNENVAVTNVFCTVSDCNFDFSSPTYFKKASRTIVHVGEVRLTSNLISPSGPVQTYNVSIGNVSVHLSNKRNEYQNENCRISCNRLILQDGELSSNLNNVPLSHSLDDALFRMNFIAIATLDYCEAALTLSSQSEAQSVRSVNSQNSASEALTTLVVSFGRVHMYSCKDSFECFVGTLNELILKMTMPTNEELEVMRAEFFSKHEAKHKSSSFSDDESDSSTDQFVVRDSQTLTEVMGDNLFSNDDEIENILFDEMSDETTQNDVRSRTSTWSTIPENELSSFHQSKDDTEARESETSHTVIHDFYEVGTRSSTQETNNLHNSENAECWTAVDHPWSDDPSIPEGEEQFARWYALDDEKKKAKSAMPQLTLPNGATVIVEGDPGKRKPRIFNRHIPLKASSDPLSGGDMGASSYAGTKKIEVKLRILITDMSLNCRLFDGYDWPISAVKPVKKDMKSKLLGDLMGGTEESESPIFADTREDASSNLKEMSQRKARQSERYFQFTYSGLKLRLDSVAKSEEHHLASCMELKLTDMIFIETVSGEKPVKLVGEWVNEEEHPRDSNDGVLMMKMVTLHPETQFAADGKLMGDEGHVVLEFLPIRFFIHQSTLRFMRQFFKNEDVNENEQDNNEGPPDMFFPTFKVKPFDIKVDYKPLEVDRSALKDGSYIQLLNLLPLEDMILRLNGVEMRNLTGWGTVIFELACKWLQDVSSTQMHKFLTRTTPIHPIANVGDGVKNFVLIPLKEYKQKGNVQKALRKSTTKLMGIVAYETLSVGAKLTGYAAKKLNKGKKKVMSEALASEQSSRPEYALPRNMSDVSDRAIESLSRGLKEANAKIIIMPYREYQKTGTKGAMKKVVKGIPVAVCAPLGGAVEALSHGLYGATNQLRPDLFEEREASKRFHDEEF